jgi:hypothetical protein
MKKHKQECLINYVYVINFFSYLLNFRIIILPKKQDLVQIQRHYPIFF